MEEGKQREIAELGEFGLIDHLTEGLPLTNEASLKGVGDDAARDEIQGHRCACDHRPAS